MIGRWWTLCGLCAGLLAGLLILGEVGFDKVVALMARGGAGLGLVILFHLTQIVATAAAWRALSRFGTCGPSLRFWSMLRLVREGINGLLPVAQVGGLVMAVRLLCRSGQRPADATAGVVVDASMEIATQFLFTLLGAWILIRIRGGTGLDPGVFSGIAFLASASGAVIAAQRLGGARLAERFATRLGWPSVEGLHEAIAAIFGDRRAIVSAASWHLLAWLLGGVEVALAFHLFGWDVGLGVCLVVECLGQAVRTAGFAVPAALGIQEGGYVVACGLVGLPADLALALSLTKRLREIAFGVLSIALWHWMERRLTSMHGP